MIREVGAGGTTKRRPLPKLTQTARATKGIVAALAALDGVIG